MDSKFGTFDDICKLSESKYLMFDFMINHISRSSDYFKDFQLKKDDSLYANLFLRYKDFWPNGEPSQRDVELIYKRKPRSPYIDIEFMDGTCEKLWCTFDEEQVDLNAKSDCAKEFIKENLIYLAENGADIIRLDAFAYASKKYGTDCFFVEPDVWELLEYAKAVLEPYNVEILPEIHEHYSIQQKLAKKGYLVYDFALPMLVLHALYSGSSNRLANWLRICPKNQFTTLDTHDGIGVVDVLGLLSEEEIKLTKDNLYSKGANVKRAYNTIEYNNLDIYQINCTYYSALGDNDDAYLLARAIQFFAPGIPQVYYVGLLAGKNDLELLEKTKVGRNVNRHYYSKEEVEREVKRPVVKKLMNLIKFRNECSAFDGDIEVIETDDGIIIHRMGSSGMSATLEANLKNHKFSISYGDKCDPKQLILEKIENKKN